MVAVVEPGVILTRLKQAVEAEGLYYPPDPASADFCTIGGNVAECAGGAVAVQYGVTRDYVLGLEVVLPTGEIITAGTRTMKGVVGYDLTRLFLGSEGTLGVITRITLRLVAKPPARQTLAAGFTTLAAAAEAVSLILTSGLAPTALEFMDHVTLSCVREMLPFELPEETAALLLIAVDGHPRDVEDRAARMARFCREQGANPVLRAKTVEEAEGLWRARKVISPALLKVKPHKVSEDVAVPLGAIPALITGLQKISRRRGLIIPSYGHAGDGNIHVNVLYDRQVARGTGDGEPGGGGYFHHSAGPERHPVGGARHRSHQGPLSGDGVVRGGHSLAAAAQSDLRSPQHHESGEDFSRARPPKVIAS